jgi:hypothetical protein
LDLGTSNDDGCEREDGADADAVEEEVASQADDGSTENVEDIRHSKFDLGTGDIDGYEGENGHDAD